MKSYEKQRNFILVWAPYRRYLIVDIKILRDWKITQNSKRLGSQTIPVKMGSLMVLVLSVRSELSILASPLVLSFIRAKHSITYASFSLHMC